MSNQTGSGEIIQNILSDEELSKNSVCRNFQQTASDSKDYNVTMYLDYAEAQAKSRKKSEAIAADAQDISEIEGLAKRLENKGGEE